MTEAQFKALNGERWKSFATLLLQRDRKRFAKVDDVVRFPAAYRKLCRDLNLARASQYSPALIDDLNRMVWEGHQVLYRRGRGTVRWAAVLVSDFPRTLRRLGLLFAVCHVLFYGFSAAAWFYVQSGDERAERLVGAAVIADYVAMYDPTAEHFLHPRGVSGDADMFGFYINNNLTIGFRTFAAGALAGLGSLVLLVFNGIMFGAAAGVVAHAGFSHTFFPFVVGHGAFELTAILIFATAGFRLGAVLVNPGARSRVDALRDTGLEVLPLVGGGAVFLFIAACLEAFWSSLPLPAEWKYGVGAVLWVLVYSFLLLGGRRAGR